MMPTPSPNGATPSSRRGIITRPTTDRVRENVFNVIASEVKQSRVLDLFAGTGAYGLEAHSRGASEVVFNDIDVEIIKRNCKLVGCNGVVLNLDYKKALEKIKGQQFDLIFLDPPYDSDYISTALDIIRQKNLLSANGTVIIETDKNSPPWRGGCEADGVVYKVKKYGRAHIYFLSQKPHA